MYFYSCHVPCRVHRMEHHFLDRFEVLFSHNQCPKNILKHSPREQLQQTPRFRLRTHSTPSSKCPSFISISFYSDILVHQLPYSKAGLGQLKGGCQVTFVTPDARGRREGADGFGWAPPHPCVNCTSPLTPPETNKTAPCTSTQVVPVPPGMSTIIEIYNSFRSLMIL